PADPSGSIPDYRTTEVPKHRTTEVPERPQTEDFKEPNSLNESMEYRSASVPKYRSTAVPETKYYKKSNEATDHLDRHLSPAESKVFEQIVRLTVGFSLDERQVRVSVLQERTGYGSDKTVRLALQGLEHKGVIARIGRPNNSGGITYKILSYSGTPVPEYRSTPVESTRGTPVESTGELKTILKRQNTDDEAAPLALALALARAERELSGKVTSDPSKWEDLADILVKELKLAAGRTTVSSVPAFLAEHLRRRLWKKEKFQLETEAAEQQTSAPAKKVDASKCPDCFGTSMWYPEGFEKGVARCTHSKLTVETDD
ncbi:MAG TPA: hypothetical protein VEV81_07675, partial [Pyrinomonadaceae bacterium]|nr:hypothetical protein [Pyrinomonadaceae bacterium]